VPDQDTVRAAQSAVQKRGTAAVRKPGAGEAVMAGLEGMGGGLGAPVATSKARWRAGGAPREG
jgi:hypothetical protein